MNEIQRLNEIIKQLGKRYDELIAEGLQKPFAERADIWDQADLVNMRIFHFEKVRNNLTAADITVRPPSAAKLIVIEAALRNLSGRIAKDQTTDAIISAAIAILRAAGELSRDLGSRQT